MKLTSLVPPSPFAPAADARGAPDGQTGDLFRGMLVDLEQEPAVDPSAPVASRAATKDGGGRSIQRDTERASATMPSGASARARAKADAPPMSEASSAGAKNAGADVLAMAARAADGQDADEHAPSGHPAEADIASPAGIYPVGLTSFALPTSRGERDDGESGAATEAPNAVGAEPLPDMGSDGVGRLAPTFGDVANDGMVVVSTPSFESHLAFSVPGPSVGSQSSAVSSSASDQAASGASDAQEFTRVAASMPGRDGSGRSTLDRMAVRSQDDAELPHEDAEAAAGGSAATVTRVAPPPPTAALLHKGGDDRSGHPGSRAKIASFPANDRASASGLDIGGDVIAASDPTKNDVSAASPTLPSLAAASPTQLPGSPMAVPQPMMKIAEAIVAMAAPTAPAVPPDSDARHVAPARTMTLQLGGGGLGTLSIRLHVVDRALDVHLAASDPRTAAILGRDKDVLAKALHDQDYGLRTLEVTGNDAPLAASGGNHAEPKAWERSNIADTSDQRGGSRGHADTSGHEAERRQGRGSAAKEDPASRRGGDRDLFV